MVAPGADSYYAAGSSCAAVVGPEIAAGTAAEATSVELDRAPALTVPGPELEAVAAELQEGSRMNQMIRYLQVKLQISKVIIGPDHRTRTQMTWCPGSECLNVGSCCK